MPRFARGGWTRNVMVIPSVSNAAANPHFAGTGAVTLVLSQTPGFQLTFEALGFCASMTAAATAGSQIFKLRKGSASGTVLATLTLAYTDIDALGKVKQALVSATAEACTLSDAGTWSLTRTASQTDYTTEPEGYFYIRYRQRPQQDA